MKLNCLIEYYYDVIKLNVVVIKFLFIFYNFLGLFLGLFFFLEINYARGGRAGSAATCDKVRPPEMAVTISNRSGFHLIKSLHSWPPFIIQPESSSIVIIIIE